MFLKLFESMLKTFLLITVNLATKDAPALIVHLVEDPLPDRPTMAGQLIYWPERLSRLCSVKVETSTVRTSQTKGSDKAETFSERLAKKSA